MAERMTLSEGDERKSYVRKMFNSIASRYDLLNHLLSFGLDIYWRKKAISKLSPGKTYRRILDLACGTGDFALETAGRLDARITGADIAHQMLKIGKDKARGKRLDFINADGEHLPLKTQSFDAVTIAFGIRNMGYMQQALSEMHRILNRNGEVIILEFSLPRFAPFRALYLFYFNHILPRIGRLISGHIDAYTYLPASVESFPVIEDFMNRMKKTGFRQPQHWKLLFGVAVIYKGVRGE